MTDKQPEALRLATALTDHVEYYGDGYSEEQGCLAAAELRRQHDEIKRLQKLNQTMLETLTWIADQTYDSWTNGAEAQRHAAFAVDMVGVNKE